MFGAAFSKSKPQKLRDRAADRTEWLAEFTGQNRGSYWRGGRL